MNCGESDIRLLQVHHIKPFKKGGSNKPANLSVLCPNCHQRAEKGLIQPSSVTELRIVPHQDEPAKPPSHLERESKVEQSHIFGPNVGVGSTRDVHIYQNQSPQSISPPSTEHKKPDDWEIDEEFTLESDGHRFFDLELGVGEKLSGLVEADGGDVSCYTLGPNSLQSFEDGDDFNPYWESEDVTRVKVSFKPKSGHKFFFVVYRDADADEDVSVSVKLRTEK